MQFLERRVDCDLLFAGVDVYLLSYIPGLSVTCLTFANVSGHNVRQFGNRNEKLQKKYI